MKTALKAFTNLMTRGALTPLVKAMRAEQVVFGSSRADSVFQAYSQTLSLVPGLSGEFLRRSFYSHTFTRCGDDFTVGFGTVFSKQEVIVGDRVYVGMRCTIGHAVLADHVTIGSNVDILSGKAQHRFDDLDQPIQDQGGTFTTVSIGENSWIGNGSIIMADIGESCIIGAGTVVSTPLPDRVIAVGNPARIVKER